MCGRESVRASAFHAPAVGVRASMPRLELVYGSYETRSDARSYVFWGGWHLLPRQLINEWNRMPRRLLLRGGRCNPGAVHVRRGLRL